MKGIEGQQNKETYPQEIVNLIAESPEAIEASFKQTKNSWVACAKDRLLTISTALVNARTQNEISDELNTVLSANIDQFSLHLQMLLRLFPTREKPIPEEANVKEEVFRRFRVLMEKQEKVPT